MKIDPDTLPLPKEPYRGILPFRLLDWRIFFERDIETERLTNLVTMYRGVLLYGQSGAGKSSLLNAGLLPYALSRGRAPERIRVFPEREKELFIERIPLLEENTDLIAEGGLPAYLPSRFTTADNEERVALSTEKFLEYLRSPSDLGEPLLIFDQFEELVTLFEENPKNQVSFEHAQAARSAIEDLLYELLLNSPQPLKIIFAFRDDYLARLTPLFSRIPNLLDQRVLLMPPRHELVSRIVRGPFMPSESAERGLHGHFEDELSEELTEKMAVGLSERSKAGILNLSELQTLCLTLWRQPKLRGELLSAADPAAVLQKILESEALSSLKRFLLWDRVSALALLSNLVTEEGTRDVVSEENLIGETRRIPLMWIHSRYYLKKLLKKLIAETGLLRRSLSSGTTYYELSSEFLIPWLQSRQRQFRKLALIVWGYISVGILILFCVAVKSCRDQEIEHQRAETAKKAADELINFMQHELSDKLEGVGRLDLMYAVNKGVMKYYKDHPPEDSDSDARLKKAWAFIQLGDLLLKEGKLNDVLQSYRESLNIAQKLVKQDFFNADWQHALSVSYERVGNVQKAQGDLTRALQSYRKSLAIAQKLVQQNSLNTDWQHDRSVSYQKVGDVQRVQGDLAGALQSYRESLNIRDQLVRQDALKADWQRDLSVSYQKVGDVQRAQGDLTSAQQSYRESLNIAQKSPLNADSQSNLSVSHERIGDVRRALNDLTGALESYRESLRIRNQLVEHDSLNIDWLHDLSVSYEKVGNVLRAQGNLTGAQQSYRESLNIAKKLFQHNSLNTDWQRDLSVSYERVGDVQRAQGNLTGALQSYRESLCIRYNLVLKDDLNADWQRDLSANYHKIGDVQRVQGNLTGALKSYRDSLDITEKYVEKDVLNADWQRARSVSYQKIGDAQIAQNELTAALKSYDKSLSIRNQLAQQDALNADWQHDLSISYQKIGNVQLAQNDFTGALKSYRDSLSIRKKLVQKDDRNADWQRALSFSYEGVGDVLRAQGDLTGALQSYHASLAIRKKLAWQNTGNARWQLDLAYSMRNIAFILLSQNKADKAKPHFETFLTIADQLGTADPANYLVQTTRSNARAYLADCENQRSPKGRAKAQALLQEAVNILVKLKENTGLQPIHKGWLQDYQEKLLRLSKLKKKAK